VSLIPTSTLITRRSITEIKWIASSGPSTQSTPNQPEPFPSVNDVVPGELQSATPNPDEQKEEARLVTGKGMATATQADILLRKKPSRGQAGHGQEWSSGIPGEPDRSLVDAVESDIFSFPPLRNRSSTNDWLTPPANFATLMSAAKPADLYNCGVDAHVGNARLVPATVADEPVKARPCDDTLFRDGFFGGPAPSPPTPPPHAQRRATTGGVASLAPASSSLPPISPIVRPSKRLGRSIGSSSRRRRSVPGPRPGVARAKSSPHLDRFVPGFVEKLRRGSSQVANRINSVFHLASAPRTTPHSDTETSSMSRAPARHVSDTPNPPYISQEDMVRAFIGGAGTPEEDVVVTGSATTRQTPSFTQATLDRLPQPVRPDTVGIYEAMTGAESQPVPRVEDRCDEDYRPHLCELSADPSHAGQDE
jgi:hypothetical protein